MDQQNIVITSTGCITALGNSLDAIATGLAAPPVVSSARTFEFHELPAETPCFRVTSYDPAEVLGKKGLRLKDWSTKLLLGALELGFKDRYEGTAEEERPGICIGTAFGSVESIGDFLSDSIVGGVNHVNPQLFANTVINSPTGNANIRFTVRSLSTTIATGFNAGLDAIIYACDYIKNGYLEAILTGGIEEVSYYGLVGLLRSGALSKGAAVRPFASDADGTVAGEGCALFMLETEESARSRGATVIAQIAGTGSTFDPDGFDGDGEACGRAMSMACDMAGIEPARAGFIAASANGNRAGDRTEAAAIRKIFGDTPVAAYKTKTGECYGASPAITLACALADMKNGRITGTGTTYQPVSGINLVSQTRKAAVEYVVVNACSCDGNNSCVVLKNR